jgi:hypothetical protein
MSLGVYPVFEAAIPSAKFSALGEVLAANFETLDEIAKDAALTPFTAFADMLQLNHSGRTRQNCFWLLARLYQTGLATRRISTIYIGSAKPQAAFYRPLAA